ncbi:MAG: adenosylmethionine--8-amino-7-oxononanoate transaminase [Schleiferiaceae bacterium]
MESNTSTAQKSLSERDVEVLWHPYTQMKGMPLPVPVTKASGALLHTEDGREIIDAVASWWVNPHGHGHPHLAESIKQQIIKVDHVIFAGFTHDSAVDLGEKFLDIENNGHARVFYADNGSTAVEVALKMCLQRFHNQGKKKTTFIAFEDAFHGDTFGAMAVSGEGVFTHAFADMLMEVIRIPVPVKGKENETKAAMQKALEREDIAGFIFEPLLLGAAGMIMYEPEILDELVAMCKARGVMTIADEVMTGFGRTGKMFACDYLENKPDVACYSKCLTGGILPMSITTCTDEIYRAFYDDDPYKTFMHGHSFTANSVGCAASLASLEIFEKENTLDKIARINEQHVAFAKTIENHERIAQVRTLGVVIAMEIQTDEETSYLNSIRDRLYDFFMERDILLRPLGNVIYILPPYCITEAQLSKIYAAIQEMLDTL